MYKYAFFYLAALLYSPAYAIQITPPLSVVQDPPTLQANRQKQLDLIVAYKSGQLYNPNKNQNDRVVMRGYLTRSQTTNNQPVADRLVGPLIYAKQGETLNLNLHNRLPAESAQTRCPEEAVNTPHCFNTTNLHTHGLWISPEGISDNVFLKVAPGQTQKYQFKIEPDHPGGTFWYHSHLHGSTALQVSSGMVGPLIIEGTRRPVVSNGRLMRSGDIDVLWQNTARNAKKPEKTLVFQQIQYRCPQLDGNVNDCKNQIGTLENYADIENRLAWSNANHYTSINGLILGEIKVAQNQYERWRMIHGGIRDTLGLIIKELPNSSRFTAQQTLEACTSYQSVERKADLDALPSVVMSTFAQDGLTMNHLQQRRLSVLQPGYRQDALISFPSNNKYCIFDTKLNINDQINTRPNDINRPVLGGQLANEHVDNAQLIAWVNVSPTKSMQISPLRHLKVRAQAARLPNLVLDQIENNDLSAFAAHASLANSDAAVARNPKQKVHFWLGGGRLGVSPDPSLQLSYGDEYTGPGAIQQRYVRQLKLGNTEEWQISSALAGHPFHIHVNPFQIMQILDLQGRDVSAAVATDSTNLDDVQYRGLKGAWKDTLFAKQGYQIIARSKYSKFEGDFVSHCHILDHEDQGMMEIVRICGQNKRCDAALPGHNH
jgi:L-ascorbate oxidase